MAAKSKCDVVSWKTETPPGRVYFTFDGSYIANWCLERYRESTQIDALVLLSRELGSW
jgi:hypothetical protein